MAAAVKVSNGKANMHHGRDALTPGSVASGARACYDKNALATSGTAMKCSSRLEARRIQPESLRTTPQAERGQSLRFRCSAEKSW